jgi:ParB family chromosome partitioning protein
MSQNKRGLHNGLNELLSDYNISNLTEQNQGYQQLSIEQLVPGGYQPRHHFNEEDLQELSNSIRAQGIIQPLVVRKIDHHQYEIIAGERRWRAAQLAELAQVPVIIKDVSNESALAISLIENIQREDLNVIEEALALQRLIEEFDLTHDQAANAVGKSRTTVSNLLRLLNLNAEVRALVEQSLLDMGHARALLSLENKDQLLLAKRIVAKNLTARQTETLVQQWLKKALDTKEGTAKDNIYQKDPDIQRLERQLSDTLGLTVKVQHHKNGTGKIIIQYNSSDELTGILNRWLHDA